MVIVNNERAKKIEDLKGVVKIYESVGRGACPNCIHVKELIHKLENGGRMPNEAELQV